MGWTFRYANGGSVEVFGVQTESAMLEQRTKWNAEIEAARADGWA